MFSNSVWLWYHSKPSHKPATLASLVIVVVNFHWPVLVKSLFTINGYKFTGWIMIYKQDWQQFDNIWWYRTIRQVSLQLCVNKRTNWPAKVWSLHADKTTCAWAMAGHLTSPELSCQPCFAGHSLLTMFQQSADSSTNNCLPVCDKCIHSWDIEITFPDKVYH